MKKKKVMKFGDLLKTIIVENSRMDFLVDKLLKAKGDKKPKMKPEELFALVVADPESKVEDGTDIDNFNGNFDSIKKVGPYTQWLIKQYLSLNPEAEYNTPAWKGEMKALKGQFWEDLYKTTDDLKKFHRFKNRLPQEFRDINRLTIDSLYDNVKDFSLEKEKATKEDRKEASKTFVYPGSDLIYDGPNWVVTKVTDTGQAGKDAACFFGGFNQETRWCTSAPGLSWFDRYIKDGPLYQVFKKTGEKAERTGLPKERYQFHFPSGQYMDINDRQINLIKFLNQEAPELKDIFKPEFAKGLTTGKHGKRVVLNYPNDSASKFIALYGFDDFFESLPADMERFEFSKGNSRYGSDDDTSSVKLSVPEKIGDFKNLDALHLEGVVETLPNSIKNLKNLVFLSLPSNPNLKELPESLADLPKLSVINIQGTNPNIVIPEKLQKKLDDPNSNLHLFR
jgi:hypothetical protein